MSGLDRCAAVRREKNHVMRSSESASMEYHISEITHVFSGVLNDRQTTDVTGRLK